MEDAETQESDGEMEWEDEDASASAPIESSPGETYASRKRVFSKSFI